MNMCNMQETFHGVEEEHKEKIISRAGALHRQFRTRLRKLARGENGNYSVEPPPLYAHFSSVAPYWKEFVATSMKEGFVVNIFFTHWLLTLFSQISSVIMQYNKLGLYVCIMICDE